jgi:aspartate aminotransferase-like enzyme
MRLRGGLFSLASIIMDLEDNIFMLAGPVKMHPRVLKAMSSPAINHRSAEFKAINAELRENLKYLFQTTTGQVALISGSGTAGLESVVSSLLHKKDRVLNLVNGKFSERFNDLCKVFADPNPMNFEWGKAVDPEKVAAELEKGDYRAVTLCHNETSTGVTNPAKDIATLAKKHDCLFILDGITSVAGLEVKPDEWGADAVVMGSQKCIAAPAGLAGVMVSPRAYEELHEEQSCYLSLRAHIDALRDEDDTPWTPAIPLFLAFREALRILKEETIEGRIARTAKLAKASRAAVDAMGLQLFPDKQCASNTLTAIRYPAGFDDGKFRKELRESHRVVVAGGQGSVKGKIFRIGHMGICPISDLLAAYAAVEAAMVKFGHKFERGAAVRAIAESY